MTRNLFTPTEDDAIHARNCLTAHYNETIHLTTQQRRACIALTAAYHAGHLIPGTTLSLAQDALEILETARWQN